MVLSKLKRMASDLEERTFHERVLRQAMERSPLMFGETLREPVARLEAAFLEERLPEVTHLIEKHAHIVTNFPVVFAVRLNEMQIEPTASFRDWEVRIVAGAIGALVK